MDCTSSRQRLRHKLAQYGLSAALYPFAIIAAAGAPNDPAASMFTFGGFGTLGVVHSDQPLADFTSATNEGQGAGHTRAWSARTNSGPLASK